MGCGGSKVENSTLVVLCKERKELIKAASDCRYDLATAHVLYFKSLSKVGNALDRFVEEELEIVLDPPQSHMVLPSPDSVSEPNSGSLTDYVHRNLGVDQGPEPRPHRNKDQPRVDLNVEYISKVKTYEICEQQQVASFEGQEPSNSFASYSKHVSGQSSTQFTGLLHDNLRYTQDNNYSYESISLNLDSRCNWQNDFAYPQYENRDCRLYQYEIERSFEGSMDMQSNNLYYNHVHPPAPSPPEIPAWDYLNPFSIIDDVYFDHFDRDKDETGSGSDNLDLREVRERDGVPELEDEIDKNSVFKSFEERESETCEDGKLTEEKSQDRFETQEFQDNKSNLETSDKDAKQRSETFISENSDDAMKEGLGTEIDQALHLEGESLEAIPTHGSKDFHDAVNQIKHAFENAYDYGKEVSVLLEEGKIPYQHKGFKLKELASWILSLLSVSSVTCSQPQQHMLSTQSSCRLMLIDKAPEDDICRKFGDLSSTLEKLCAWERKLHEEVRDEEKLRIAYDKKCKKLKDLDDRGAESSKIAKVQASINKLLSKINVAVAALHIISTRICKLRDEELYPQLSELVQGLIRLWKSTVKCHQKQFQDIFNAQSYFQKARIGIKEKSSSKATLNFEMEISSLGARFIEYVQVQKSFIQCLKEWLFQDTANGNAPFSPSRIGAPPVFVVCNDWYRAVEKISGEGVSKAILDLASSLHALQMKQYEEHHQRLKVDYLSKDLDKRLKYLSQEHGLQYDQDALSKNANVGPSENLVLMRKRLSEQKAKHEEAVKKANEAASCCIQVGLVRALEALEKFSLDSLKAYDQVRIVGRGEDDA